MLAITFLRTVDWYLSLSRVVPHIGEVHKNNMLKIAMVNVWCLEWFNFSDATTAEEMVWFIEKAREKYRSKETIIPLVMIGHPKTFANEKELKEFLFWAANQVDISFIDYNSYLNEYQSFS